MLAAPFLWPRARPSCGKAGAGPCGGVLFKANSPGLLTCVSSQFIYLTFSEGPSPVPGRKVGAVSVAGAPNLTLDLFLRSNLPFPGTPAPRRAGASSDGPAVDGAAGERCRVRQRLPSEAGGRTLHKAVFREKLPEIAPNCAHVWCASPCQGPTQPWEPARLWSFILKGFVSLIKRELCFLLREKPAIKTARLVF